MAQSSIATAADYADAMLTARRARNLLFAFLLIILIVQIGLFCVARFTNLLDRQIPRNGSVQTSTITITSNATSNSPATTKPTALAEALTDQGLEYLVNISDFLGMAFVIVLSLVLLLMTLVMVVGRLIGVSQMTSAYLWCLLLAAMLFPWQAFLNTVDFKVPGVLYTWNELSQFAHFPTENWNVAVLKWARFIGFPVLAIVLLITIQTKSNRGLQIALGEAELEIESLSTEQKQ